MNTKNVLLGVFVALTLVFASLTLEEYSRVTPTQTLTSTTTATTITTVTNLINVTSSSASTSTVSIGESSSAISPAPCAEPYKLPATNTTAFANGTSVTEYAEPVFVIGAGSTMDVCILFWDHYTQGGVNLNYSSPPSLNATLWPGYTPGKSPPPAINVTVTPPPDFSIDTNQSVVVEYQISTGVNSTGFDGLGPSNSIPYGIFGCRSIPLAVGYSPSQVNSSDFPNYPGVLTCDMPPLIGYIIGYTGGSVVYLTEENRG